MYIFTYISCTHNLSLSADTHGGLRRVKGNTNTHTGEKNKTLKSSRVPYAAGMT